jgi:hypothetical protein
LARPAALRYVQFGLEATAHDDHEDLSHHGLAYAVADLVGHDGPADVVGGEGELAKIYECEEAAFAIGIAVGLLMRPEAFDKGGAR